MGHSVVTDSCRPLQGISASGTSKPCFYLHTQSILSYLEGDGWRQLPEIIAATGFRLQACMYSNYIAYTYTFSCRITRNRKKRKSLSLCARAQGGGLQVSAQPHRLPSARDPPPMSVMSSLPQAQQGGVHAAPQRMPAMLMPLTVRLLW